jgi:hypothetical protein
LICLTHPLLHFYILLICYCTCSRSEYS